MKSNVLPWAAGVLVLLVSMTAAFPATAASIRATAGRNGSIDPSGKVMVPNGGKRTFTITPDPFYHIADVLVDGASVGAVASYEFTNVVADHKIAAAFSANPYVLTYTAGANGAIRGDSPQTVLYGEKGTPVVAVPDPGYQFANWSDGLIANPRRDTVGGDRSVTAIFMGNQMACGLVIEVDPLVGFFLFKPRVYGAFVNPVTGKAGKANAKLLTKIEPKTMGQLLSCEWTKKVKLYDAKAFRDAEKSGTGAATWIAENSQVDLDIEVHLVRRVMTYIDILDEWLTINVEDKLVQTMLLTAPVITSIELGEPDSKGNATLVITGQWFGTKKPKVWLEYVDAKTGVAIKHQAMKVVAPTVDNTDYCDYNGKPACMDAGTGDGKVIVVVPTKVPNGVLNGTLVLDNGVGMASGDAPLN